MKCENCPCCGNDFCCIEDGKPNPQKCELNKNLCLLEETIKGLECCATHLDCESCPYQEQYKLAKASGADHCPVYDDAIVLLKQARQQLYYDLNNTLS